MAWTIVKGVDVPFHPAPDRTASEPLTYDLLLSGGGFVRPPSDIIYAGQTSGIAAESVIDIVYNGATDSFEENLATGNPLTPGNCATVFGEIYDALLLSIDIGAKTTTQDASGVVLNCSTSSVNLSEGIGAALVQSHLFALKPSDDVIAHRWRYSLATAELRETLYHRSGVEDVLSVIANPTLIQLQAVFTADYPDVNKSAEKWVSEYRQTAEVPITITPEMGPPSTSMLPVENTPLWVRLQYTSPPCPWNLTTFGALPAPIHLLLGNVRVFNPGIQPLGFAVLLFNDPQALEVDSEGGGSETLMPIDESVEQLDEEDEDLLIRKRGQVGGPDTGFFGYFTPFNLLSLPTLAVRLRRYNVVRVMNAAGPLIESLLSQTVDKNPQEYVSLVLDLNGNSLTNLKADAQSPDEIRRKQ